VTRERQAICSWSGAWMLVAAACGAAAPAAQPAAHGAADTSFMPRAQDFTFLWWSDGPPYYLDMTSPAPAPILCLQSGSIGVALDTKSLRLLHAGRFQPAMDRRSAIERGPEAIRALPAGRLEARLVRGGKSYQCVGRGEPPQDAFFFPVRFIESGRFLQRVAVEGLQFADEAGRRLESKGRLELALWPDRLTLALELEAGGATPEDELVLGAGDKQATVRLQTARRVSLELFRPAPEPAPGIQLEDGAKTEWDAGLGAWVVRLPVGPWKNSRGTYYPSDELDRMDRWRFTLRNDGPQEAAIPLVFVPDQVPAITGLTPLVCEPDGTPTGIPVQISKNWHARPDKGNLPHQGGWLHGCTFVRLPPGSRREFVFAMTYARWGGVPAASHAQLCLVGWGHNQFWDEAAIGSFGESICFEPGRVQRRCFITDVRPLMTLAQDPKPWGWANNCGGGDFLVWVDAQGRYQGFRATRTDYRAQGPCLTHVGYVEETAGGEIAARMDVSLSRSDDYLRVFFRLRYDVHRPVTWQRLAFFQLGADFYNEAPSRRVAVGDANALREEWQPPRAKDGYDRRAVPLTGSHPWASVHGLQREALREGAAAASRGLIVRSWKAVLGGRPNPVPHAATYATEWGRENFRTGAELVPPPGVAELRPGDFVEAELELVVFPADAPAYYGPNEPFRKALSQDADTWRLVQREAAGNALAVEVQQGALQGRYPVRVAVGPDQRAALSVRGGVGYVPVTFTGLTRHRGYGLSIDEGPVDQHVHGNDFWQTDYDPDARTWSITFNVPLTGGARTLRFQ